jgi:glycosyltransferase involved in cell wall biosynthesis
MRIVLFANTDWFLYNFKLPLARALRERGHEVVLVSPPGAYGLELRRMGFRWEAFELTRSGVDPFTEWFAVRRLQALYRSLQPDAVHHFTIKCVIYGSIAARAAGVGQVVNSVTGLGFVMLAKTLKARLIRPIAALLYRKALAHTKVIFQNRDNLATLSAMGALSLSETKIIPGDGVDTDYFTPASASGTGALILMMGRLLWSKGIREYVDAAAIVRAQAPHVRFLLVGSPDAGNPESVDAATLARWRAEGNVELLGQRADVLALQQSCSVAVLASTQGEGMPRALMEAAACGKPMVATDVPGSRELVVDGVNGFLVPPGDAAALAAAILELVRQPDVARRMGIAARQRLVAEFSDERIIAQTLQVYGLA